MSFTELRKFVAPEFIFGAGALNLAGQYARNLGGTRALLVSDSGVVAAGWSEKVRASIDEAGLRSVVFTQVTPNPRVEEVAAGAAIYAERACDIIIAVGGGSVIDCAKAVGVVAANGGDVHRFIGVDNVDAPMPPTICIPTTAGTSADVSQFAVLSDCALKRKLLIVSKAVVPDLALIDPTTLATMDPYLAACTGLDALVHAIEAYVSLGSSPLTDVHALEAVKLITANLVSLVEDRSSVQSANGMMLGSLEAGLAFSNASLGAVHAMAHSIGGLLDLPHGQCNSMLLDAVIDFNYPGAEHRYRDIALAMGLDKREASRDPRNSLLNEIRRLREACGVSSGLSKCGVHRTDVHELAASALRDPCVVTNPRQPTQRDLEVIYEESL